MPKTLTGAELQLDDAPARAAELFLVDGNNLAYRAFFALPEELATTEGFPTNALLGFTNMLFKLLSDYRPEGRRGRLGHEPGAPQGARRRVQGRPAADARPPARAVPALSADRGGLRLPEPRVRGVGGRRRHRHARLARRRGRGEDVRRLHRPRRLPALHRERLPDDDAARRRRRPRVHARAGLRALRRHARAGAGLHRAQGRHVRQHSRRSRHRGQDRGPAHLAVRLPRRRARARRRALARACEEPARARRPGARVEGARHDAPRPIRSTSTRPSSCSPRRTARS